MYVKKFEVFQKRLDNNWLYIIILLKKKKQSKYI